MADILVLLSTPSSISVNYEIIDGIVCNNNLRYHSVLTYKEKTHRVLSLPSAYIGSLCEERFVQSGHFASNCKDISSIIPIIENLVLGEVVQF